MMKYPSYNIKLFVRTIAQIQVKGYQGKIYRSEYTIKKKKKKPLNLLVKFCLSVHMTSSSLHGEKGKCFHSKNSIIWKISFQLIIKT